jgi:hypothetical protein
MTPKIGIKIGLICTVSLQSLPADR